MKKSLILAIVIAFPLLVFSQQRELLKANDQFQQQKYFEAIKSFELLVKNGNESPEIIEKIAEANYFNANYAQANVWYSKLVLLTPNMKSESHFRYAQTLKSVGKNDEASIQMGLFQKLNPNGSRTKLQQAKSNNESKFVFSNCKLLSINSNFSDYGPALFGKTLVFSSARNAFLNNRTSERTNQSYTSLFQTSKDANEKFSKPKLFSKGSFSIYNEATPVFTKDGKTMYYSQNQFKKDSKKQLVNGNFNLYKSVLTKDKWVNQGPVTFGQSDAIRVAHPALSPDGKFLYFASDDLTRYGESDLFKVAINDDGTFGTPENLGTKINTEGRDTFPFITEDNTLVFASDGHPGMGGLDLFSIDLNNPKATVISLGETINSTFDDFGMVISSDLTNGYFTSNKPGGKGDDDIYSFDLTIKKIIRISIKGTIVDEASQELLSNADVKLLDNENNLIASLVSYTDGGFVFENLKPNASYSISVSKSDYQANSVLLVAKETDIDKKIALEKNELPFKTGDDLSAILKLHKIYFDLGKYTIRPESKIELDKVVTFLTTYPTLKIEISSHTDSRQSAKLNQILSEKRAAATLNYIVSKGIDTKRLVGKGYGESDLSNRCADKVKCSEAEHQENRRSTFIIQ